MTTSLDFEKFRKCHALMIGGITEGERNAARGRAAKIAGKAGMSLVEAVESILAYIPAPIAPDRSLTVVADLFPEETKQPFIWAPGDACSIEHAAGVFGYSRKRMMDFVKMHGIVVGAPGSSKMWTCLAAISMIICRDFVALELLRHDEREHSRVKRHFKHAAEREAAYYVLDRLKTKRAQRAP